MKAGDRVQLTQIPPKRVINPDLIGMWGKIIDITNGRANVRIDGRGIVRQVQTRYLSAEHTNKVEVVQVKQVFRSDFEELQEIRKALLEMPYRDNIAVIQARRILHKRRAEILSRTTLTNI